jgi:hypothetical protein
VITGTIGLVLGLVISEIAFRALRRDTDREPTTVELVIPAGTSDRITAGEVVPEIPKNMVFMIGDTLLVHNEDSANHQLGPVWVPAGSSASLVLDTAENYTYSCSFTSDQYLGLDVRQRVTASTRVQAVIAVGIPTAAMLAIYSFILFPSKSKSRVI